MNARLRHDAEGLLATLRTANEQYRTLIESLPDGPGARLDASDLDTLETIVASSGLLAVLADGTKTMACGFAIGLLISGQSRQRVSAAIALGAQAVIDGCPRDAKDAASAVKTVAESLGRATVVAMDPNGGPR